MLMSVRVAFIENIHVETMYSKKEKWWVFACFKDSQNMWKYVFFTQPFDDQNLRLQGSSRQMRTGGGGEGQRQAEDFGVAMIRNQGIATLGN